MNKAKKICLFVTVSFAVLVSALVLTRHGRGQAYVPESPTAAPINLSLFFQNGQMAPITRVGDAPRYLQEIDIIATVTTTTDEGIEPVIHNSDFSFLDWTGVRMVEEDWRLDFDAQSYVRQRFYRSAKWMEQPSQFQVVPIDDAGNQVGQPLIASAGGDERWSQGDDGFVRRFVARQITRGCGAIGDCSAASDFIAQALVQFRDALHADKRARTIPAQATYLTLFWSEDSTARTVKVSHASPAGFPYGYGFKVSLEEVSTPVLGTHYLPGETLSYRVTFSDGTGNRLHPRGSLSTYGQFVRGEVESGLCYIDLLADYPTLYYALKHRQCDMEIAFSGPIDQYRTPNTVATLEQLLLPQSIQATVADDGFSSVAQIIPPASVLFAGFEFPPIWDTPISDVVGFTIPTEALPGTYLLVFKARRQFGGEALQRAALVEVQVGTTAPSLFTPQTGGCETCHTGATGLGKVLHGIEDPRACFGCHGPLYFEPDAHLDIRVHAIHRRSNRFAGDIMNCATCHLTPPTGPFRDQSVN